jgi:hypothetical protein
VSEPIIGYRAWLADDRGELRSCAVQHVRWRPGLQPAAVCHRPAHRFDEPHLGPAPHDVNHPCGWHAHFTLEQLLAYDVDGLEVRDHPGLVAVRGLVSGGGRTQEHRYGWRAQYVAPLAILRFVPDAPERRERVLLAQYLASERYGIPLIDPKDA